MRIERLVPACGLYAIIFLLITGCISDTPAPPQQASAPTPPAATPTEPEPTATDQRFDGITIQVLTHEGPQIFEPLKRRAQEFEDLTGAEVNVLKVPFGELYNEILQDFKNDTKKYDVVVFAPQWMVDYASPGYIEDLTERIEADPAIQWDDISPFFRDFSAVYNGRIYTIPLDGDFQMVYYRTDLLEEAGFDPPATWPDYLEIAQHFHGQDLNNDDTPDFGSCISKQRSSQTYHMIWSVASAFLQSQGTQQGAFFDTDTMEPLVNNEAFSMTLDIFKQTTAYGPPR